MKRLLCFYDGTWNRPDVPGEMTNIVKLHNAVVGRTPRGIDQIAHYQVGIATENLGHWTFAAGAIGYGVGDRIRRGYRFFVETYEPGDEIYLFGFSRGAFQARSTSGLMSLIGILKAEHADRIDDAWDYYQAHRTSPDPARLASLKALCHPPARIRLVGVWDTVGNLGLPFLVRSRINKLLGFHNTQLSANVDIGLHALAIDEPRGPFSPTLWTMPIGQAPPKDQIIEQVWFPGSHANVGGGFPDTSLSDISLLWMATRAMDLTGVVFNMASLRSATKPDPLGEDVLPTTDNVFRLTPFLPFVRLIQQDPQGIPRWRRSLLGGWRTSRLPDDVETVGESIHISARQRFLKTVPRRRGHVTWTQTYAPRTLARALRHNGDLTTSDEGSER